MGQTLLQIGRSIMLVFWFIFILVELRMATLAWPQEALGPQRYLAMALFLIAAYAGFGMALGLLFRITQARETNNG